MKAMYQLWRKPGHRGRYERISLHAGLQDAAAATAVPDIGAWHPAGVGHDSRYVDTADGTWLISPERVPENDDDRIELAIDLALEYGAIDGGHHKMWVIDQMLRALAGERYEDLIIEYRSGEDGPDTYSWDEGIAP